MKEEKENKVTVAVEQREHRAADRERKRKRNKERERDELGYYRMVPDGERMLGGERFGQRRP